jgi:hypothetical protein
MALPAAAKNLSALTSIRFLAALRVARAETTDGYLSPVAAQLAGYARRGCEY